jgi:dihydropteroate synthase
MRASEKLSLKRMGVMNFTPNSFSDAGELSSSEKVKERLAQFGSIDSLDIGAESTAPKNAPISFSEEWERLKLALPMLKDLDCALSIDTYHLETISKFADLWLQEKITRPLIWNDVSGKFDHSVTDFLSLSPNFHYVLCHNLAPSRELTSFHMDYIKQIEGERLLDELKDFFFPHIHPQVIFDPCLGFSKTYEQNWLILNSFHRLREKVPHNRWLIGFSRKSFLKKKYEINDLPELDRLHVEEVKRLSSQWQGSEVWIRTHRPELLNYL